MTVLPQEFIIFTPQLLDKTDMFIPTIAERKSYGIKKDTPLTPSEDTQKEALYAWELTNINILETPNIRDIKARRDQRKLLGQKLHRVSKLVNLIKEVINKCKCVQAKGVDDLKRLSDAEENYLKIKRKEVSQKQKIIDQKAKEVEKKSKEDQKKLIEEQKAEEKRKLKEEQKRIREEQKAEEKKAKKRKHEEMMQAKQAEEAEQTQAKKQKEKELAEAKEPKKDPMANQKTLISFFGQVKSEPKKPGKQEQPNKIYTEFETKTHKLSFKKVDLKH